MLSIELSACKSVLPTRTTRHHTRHHTPTHTTYTRHKITPKPTQHITPRTQRYPECWSDGKPDSSGHIGGVDCSKEVHNATVTWLNVGGRRIDNGDTYANARTIGQAMLDSGVPRSEIFLVSKLGSGLPMGDAEFRFQTDAVLKMYQVNDIYVCAFVQFHLCCGCSISAQFYYSIYMDGLSICFFRPTMWTSC